MTFRSLVICCLVTLCWTSIAIASIGVTPNTATQSGTTNNDFLNNPLQVNDDVMFGFDDWVFAEKLNFPGDAVEDVDIGLIITGNDLSGTWTIDNIWGMDVSPFGVITDVMIVLKSGGGNIIPDLYQGYLISYGATTGSFHTPFVNGNNGTDAQISHISVYFRAGDPPLVPEPSSLLVWGSLAFSGIALGRRRR